MIKIQIVIFGCFLIHIISSLRLHSATFFSPTLFSFTTTKYGIIKNSNKAVKSLLKMVSTDVFSPSSSKSSFDLQSNNNSSNNNQNNNSYNNDSSWDPSIQSFSPHLINDVTEIMKTNNWKIIPDIWDTLAKKIPNQLMLVDEIHASVNPSEGTNNNSSTTLPPVSMVSLTYSQANRRIIQGATTLQQKLGILPGDCVAMFAENSYRWFLLDQSIMKTGACNAVRGISAPTEELHYIYKNSRCVGMVLENCQILSNLFQNYALRGKMLKSPNDDYSLPKFVIVLYSEGMSGKDMYEKYIIHHDMNNNNTTTTTGGSNMNRNDDSFGNTLKFIKENDVKLLSYEEFEQMSGGDSSSSSSSSSNNHNNDGIMTASSQSQSMMNSKNMSDILSTKTSLIQTSTASNEFRPIVRDGGSTATIVYTSGTTSRPKGVLLRHRNLMYQILENSLVSEETFSVPVTTPVLIPPSLVPPAVTSWGVKYVFFQEWMIWMMKIISMQWRHIHRTLSNPITITTPTTTPTTTTITTTITTASITGKAIINPPTTSHSTSSSSSSSTTAISTTTTSISTVNPQVGDVFVSVLPCWHIFERTCEYLALARGTTVVYSNLKHFKKDICHKRPHLLIVVPRLLESIQKGIISNLTQQKGFNQQLVDIATKIADLYNHCHKIYSNRYLSDIKPFLIQRVLFGLFTFFLYPLYFSADYFVWSKIRLGLGGRIKAIVSGGASLPVETDLFFERIGLPILNGYGMTETSPVIANRKADYNVIGSVGTPVHKTMIKIIDPDSHECIPVGSGKSGLLYVKGPGLMAGYISKSNNNGNGSNNNHHHNHGSSSSSSSSSSSNGYNQHSRNNNNNNNNINNINQHHQKITAVTAITASVSPLSVSSASAIAAESLDREGYFNTGDLAKIDIATGCLVITGRYKDTIVLSNGENVTPEPIEERIIASSPLIDQVMLVGQDKKNLAALIVINTKEWAIHCSSDSSSDTSTSSSTSGTSTSASSTGNERNVNEVSHPNLIIRPMSSGLKESSTSSSATSASSSVTPPSGSSGLSQGTVFLTQQAARHQALKIDTKSLNDDPQLRQVIRNAIDHAQGSSNTMSSGVSSDSGTKQRAWERVSAFTLLSEPFAVENGLLTQTLKIKRSAVADRYAKEIQNMYSNNQQQQQQQQQDKKK